MKNTVKDTERQVDTLCLGLSYDENFGLNKAPNGLISVIKRQEKGPVPDEFKR